MSEKKIIATEHDLVNARIGVINQYEAIFDANTRQQLEELGIQKFINYVVDGSANQQALIRFYATCLHPKG
jgi:hypothetical protein